MRRSTRRKSTCLRRGFLPVGSLCGCAGGSWLGELGSARTVTGARSLIIGVNCTLECASQGHTDPGVRGRVYDAGRLAQLGYLWWLPPDGKTQVTIEHVQQVDEIVAGKNGDLWWLLPDGKMQVVFEHVTDVYRMVISGGCGQLARRRCSGWFLRNSSSRTDRWF